MPAQRKYPEELRERAVKTVFEVRGQDGTGRGEIVRVARQLGVQPGCAAGPAGPKSTAALVPALVHLGNVLPLESFATQ